MFKESTTIVTIDGPMASGKTSVCASLAKKLKWNWVSTGVFYRGLAYIAQMKSLNLESEDSLKELTDLKSWKIELSEEKTRFFFEGKDITDSLYEDDVAQISSYISIYPKLREGLIQAQRDCVKKAINGGILFEGRDCGTVLFPDARLKFYLTAFRDDRIKRRIFEERQKEEKRLKQKGGAKKTLHQQEKKKIDEVIHKESVYFRDIRDSSRSFAPLRIPRQAFFVNTSDMSLDEVVSYVYKVIMNHLES